MKFVPSPSASYSAPSKPFAFISFADPALQPLSFHIVTKLLGGPPSNRSFPLHFFRFFRTLFALSPLSRTLTEKHRGYPPEVSRNGTRLSRRSSDEGPLAPQLWPSRACRAGALRRREHPQFLTDHWSLISVSALYRAAIYTAPERQPFPAQVHQIKGVSA